jgi:hypothetical protein
MNGLGLVSVLPVASFIALAVLAISFCLTIQRARPPQALLLAHIVLLVFFLYALPTLVEPEPRFAVTWRHVGIIGSIAESGHVDPRIDAYFNWPGFFVRATSSRWPHGRRSGSRCCTSPRSSCSCGR